MTGTNGHAQAPAAEDREHERPDEFRRAVLGVLGTPRLSREEQIAELQRLFARVRTGDADGVTLPATAAGMALAVFSRPLPAPVSTGLDALDDAIGGFRAGSTYVFPGPPGQGKTALVLQLARGMAQHTPVLYLGSELAVRQVLARLAAPKLGDAWASIFDSAPARAAVIADALADLRRLRVVEVGPTTDLLNVTDVVTKVEGRPPIVILDYLQHVARRTCPDDMRLAVSRLTDTVVSWARQTDSVALVVSSAGRAKYNADGGALEAIDSAKESGDVEYDAAGVIRLDVKPGGEATLKIAKNRFGPAGMTIGLRADLRLGVFEGDPAAGLSEAQRAVFDAVTAGAHSGNQIAAALKEQGLGKQRKAVQDAIRELVSRGLVTDYPHRIPGKERESSGGTGLVPSDGDVFAKKEASGTSSRPGTDAVPVPVFSTEKVVPDSGTTPQGVGGGTDPVGVNGYHPPETGSANPWAASAFDLDRDDAWGRGRS